MVKLKMKTGEYYSSDYSKYPLNSLKPFILLFILFLFLFLFVLLEFFFYSNFYIEIIFSICLSVFIFYWVYLVLKYPVTKMTATDLIIAKTRFEKQTAKTKFQEKIERSKNSPFFSKGS